MGRISKSKEKMTYKFSKSTHTISQIKEMNDIWITQGEESLPVTNYFLYLQISRFWLFYILWSGGQAFDNDSIHYYP